ncbi:MFS transporter [Metallosphaera hakonensis]|uniref:MFS transporter n=1 Tax=Metallosphaera hakonensis JCM 8857 = DSM 7519 TaxID=1293036 RepID=A0A2U9IRD0_9CREN|nr:MFS transporter [Metallosphaera hakonensis]AWR98592.1 MFS transporter [Metallosphaera hakonensis JCM 8857 = DSM 7519]
MNKLTIFASMVGTIVEWYDVFIFSSGAIYIGTELFPSKNPVAAILGVLLVFALGFVTRPVGALFFGHFGDKSGRKRTLIYTLILSGTASGFIGLLPTYSQAGILTIMGLTALRLILGFGLGGEWGGAILLVVENTDKRRAFYSSFVQSTVGIGLLLGSLLFLVLSLLLPRSAMFSFGWRIPFLVSFVLVIIGLAVRLKVDETRLFKEVKERGDILAFPSSKMFKRYWKELLLGTVFAGSLGTIFYVGAILLPLVYQLSGTVTSSLSFLGITLFAVMDILFVFLGGIFSDSLGRKPVLLLSNLLSIALIYPVFMFKSILVFYLALFLYGAFHGLSYSPLAALLSEIFPTNIRYTGSSSAYQFGNSFIGGPASYASTYLGSVDYLLYPVYLVVVSAVTIILILRMKETRTVELT